MLINWNNFWGTTLRSPAFQSSISAWTPTMVGSSTSLGDLISQSLGKGKTSCPQGLKYGACLKWVSLSLPRCDHNGTVWCRRRFCGPWFGIRLFSIFVVFKHQFWTKNNSTTSSPAQKITKKNTSNPGNLTKKHPKFPSFVQQRVTQMLQSQTPQDGQRCDQCSQGKQQSGHPGCKWNCFEGHRCKAAKETNTNLANLT